MKSLANFSLQAINDVIESRRSLSRSAGKLTLAVAILWSASASYAANGAAAKQPDFNGLWQITSKEHAALKPADGKALPLTDMAKAQYEKNMATLKTGKNSIDAMSRCLPPGVPRVLLMPKPFKLVQNDKYLAFLFDWNHQSRWVYINREHFEPIGPTFFGQSIAKWDGETLVIDTTDFNGDTFLDDSGLPHSDQLHVVERLRLKTPSELEDRISITDPATFTQPWDTVLNFKKAAGDTVANDDWCLGKTGLVPSTK